jgi:hypothetical protein
MIYRPLAVDRCQVVVNPTLRTFFIIAGFAFGLLLTWLSIYTVNHIDWLIPAVPRQGGCFDRDDCEWWVAPMFIGYFFLLPVLFGVLNGVAWKRWPLRKWGRWFVVLSLFTSVFHLGVYVVPH